MGVGVEGLKERLHLPPPFLLAPHPDPRPRCPLVPLRCPLVARCLLFWWQSPPGVSTRRMTRELASCPAPRAFLAPHLRFSMMREESFL